VELFVNNTFKFLLKNKSNLKSIGQLTHFFKFLKQQMVGLGHYTLLFKKIKKEIKKYKVLRFTVDCHFNNCPVFYFCDQPCPDSST
jgi:hypothetical protein